jgi:hypothetical protein
MSQSALNDEQFASHLRHSSPEELLQHWDPNLKNPEALRDWSGPGYIEGLKEDIRQRGIQDPIQVRRPRTPNDPPMIYDGHHRLLVALDEKHSSVPWKYVSGIPGEQ